MPREVRAVADRVHPQAVRALVRAIRDDRTAAAGERAQRFATQALAGRPGILLAIVGAPARQPVEVAPGLASVDRLGPVLEAEARGMVVGRHAEVVVAPPDGVGPDVGRLVAVRVDAADALAVGAVHVELHRPGARRRLPGARRSRRRAGQERQEDEEDAVEPRTDHELSAAAAPVGRATIRRPPLCQTGARGRNRCVDRPPPAG